jgi:quercetin dioxygenase-like cupin family protein
MNNRTRLLMVTLAGSLVLLLGASARGQEPAGQGMGRNMAEMKFVAFPGLPTCAKGAVQNGDPSKGPSIILAKASAGCAIPWHWHTPNENLMMLSGVARLEMKDGKPLLLHAGGYALMPSHHVHQFRCEGPCSVYIYSDVAFDIHYVDAQAKEITPQEALKAVKEMAAMEMK